MKPEQREAFLQQAQEDAELARRFQGCVQMLWSGHLEEPNSFTLYEEWETPAAFDAFKTSEAFKHSGDALFAMFVEAPKTAYYITSKM